MADKGGLDLVRLWLQNHSKLMPSLTPPPSSASLFPTFIGIKHMVTSGSLCLMTALFNDS